MEVNTEVEAELIVVLACNNLNLVIKILIGELDIGVTLFIDCQTSHN